jgi:hypothetical protein
MQKIYTFPNRVIFNAGIFFEDPYNIKHTPLKPAIQLIRTFLLTVGDDATHLLILDKEYKQVESIRLFDYPEKRIPKAEKADFESSTIISLNNIPHLFIIGSASTEKRKKAVLLPVQNAKAAFVNLFHPFFYREAFLQQLKTNGITEINIEGSTIMGDSLVLSNRGNDAHRINHLIFTPTEAMNAPVHQTKVSLSVIPLALPVNSKEFIGVSELCYVESKDILFITLSSEATNNAYDDGVIGDSYIGWIYNARGKMHNKELVLDEMINLSTVDKAFIQQKIEGICIESVKDGQFNIHLVSDNDKGESRLFHIKVGLG